MTATSVNSSFISVVCQTTVSVSDTLLACMLAFRVILGILVGWCGFGTPGWGQIVVAVQSWFPLRQVESGSVIILNSTRLCFNNKTHFSGWWVEFTALTNQPHLLCVQVLALIWIFTRLLYWNPVIAHSHSSSSGSLIKANLLQSKLLICLQETILVDHAICCKRIDVEWSGSLFCLLWGFECQVLYMMCAHDSVSWYT